MDPCTDTRSTAVFALRYKRLRHLSNEGSPYARTNVHLRSQPEPLSRGIPFDSRIAADPRFLKHSALTPERLQQIRELNDIAIERGQTLAEMSLAWLLHDDAVTSVLAGASKPQQILDNIGALSNTNFSSEELARIDEISKR